MPKFCIPLEKPRPNSDKFINVLMGKENIDKPRLIEFFVDNEIMAVILERLIGRKWTFPYKPGHLSMRLATNDTQKLAAFWDNYIEFWYRMGYDCVMPYTQCNFTLKPRIAKDTAGLSRGNRTWGEEKKSLIESWEDFETYPWPKLEDTDFFPFEYVSTHMPDEMKMMIGHRGGPFEWLMWILSIEGLSILLYENPDLVEAIVNRISNLIVEFYEYALEIPNICAIYQGDDMGFKTSTIISPKHLIQYVLPWHKKIAQMAHTKGIPYFLHSCGNIEKIMDSLIEDAKIDGIHSFQDVIISAAEFKKKYGDKIAVLGGVDVDYLSRRSPEEVRRYVRKLIDNCAPGGRFAVGSGNSIANYVPIDNYLTMLDETLKQ